MQSQWPSDALVIPGNQHKIFPCKNPKPHWPQQGIYMISYHNWKTKNFLPCQITKPTGTGAKGA